MMGAWIFWILFLGLLGLAAVLTAQPVIAAIFSAAGLLFLADLLLFLFLPVKCRLQADFPAEAPDGTVIAGRLKIGNAGSSSFGLLRFRLRVTNTLNGQIREKTLQLPLYAKEEREIALKIKSPGSGTLVLSAEGAQVHDLLGLLRRSVPLALYQTIDIRKEAVRDESAPRSGQQENMENGAYLNILPGNDLSEVYTYREFQPADALRQINWKLSAKKDRLIVKEGSIPDENSRVVLSETDVVKHAEQTGQTRKEIGETAAAAGRFSMPAEEAGEDIRIGIRKTEEKGTVYSGIFQLLLSGMLLAGILLTWIRITGWESSPTAWLNKLLSVYGARTGRIVPVFALPEKPFLSYLWAAALLLALFFAIAGSIRAKQRLLPFLFAAAAFAAALYFETASFWSVFFLALPVCLLWTGRKEKRCTAHHMIRGGRLGVFCGMTLMFTAAALTGAALWGALLQPEQLSGIRAYLSDGVFDLLYGKNEALWDGDFTDLKPFSPEEEKVQLQLEADAYYPCYLKGFTATVYQKDGWAPLSNVALFQSADLFYWLQEEGFYPRTQCGRLAAAAGWQADNSMQVRYLHASRRAVYAPYETVEANLLTQKGRLSENTALPAGTRTAQYRCLSEGLEEPAQFARLLQAGGTASAEITGGEAHYRDLVRQTDLEVPDGLQPLLESMLGSCPAAPEEYLSYGQAKERIRKVLTDTLQYDPGAVYHAAGDGDFISSFLQVTGRGYSVHFASAAVMMFRYYHIPARYAEGYIVRPEDLADHDPDTPLVLTACNAHAWAEYYQNGVGWIPFEATPGYAGQMEVQPAEDVQAQTPDTPQTDAQENPAEAQPPQPEEMRRIAPPSFGRMLLFLLFLLLLAGCIAAAVRIGFRARRLRSCLAACRSGDGIQAVCAIFTYTAHLLIYYGILKDDDSVYAASEILTEKFGAAYCKKYESVFNIYEKARFGNESPNRQALEEAEAFRRETIRLLTEKDSALKRRIDRRIRFLYD